jgi:hypothetical protein
MIISEKDIFDYLYYKESLDSDKVKYIEEHQNQFSESLEYYMSYKDSLDNDVDDNTKKKFFSGRITEDLYVMQLFPKLIEIPEPDKKLKLAADTVNLNVNPFTQTFVDKNSSIIVRLVGQKAKTTIYVFSTENKKLKNIIIELLPAKKIYQMANNLSFLEIEEELNAQEIKITFEVEI